MEEKKEKPFSALRWNEYQSVKPLKIYVKPTEETKKKISVRLKGRKKLANHCKHISQSLQGLKKTKEHKEHLSASLKAFHNNNKTKEERNEKE